MYCLIISSILVYFVAWHCPLLDLYILTIWSTNSIYAALDAICFWSGGDARRWALGFLLHSTSLIPFMSGVAFVLILKSFLFESFLETRFFSDANFSARITSESETPLSTNLDLLSCTPRMRSLRCLRKGCLARSYSSSVVSWFSSKCQSNMIGAPSAQHGLSPIVCLYSRTETDANEVLRWTHFLAFTAAWSKEVARWIQEDGMIL